MDFYTTVLRRSGPYWVAMCLENGLAGQGDTKEQAVEKMKEAIESLEDAIASDPDIYTLPVSIQELHEFLTVEDTDPFVEEYVLRAVHA